MFRNETEATERRALKGKRKAVAQKQIGIGKQGLSSTSGSSLVETLGQASPEQGRYPPCH